MRLVLFEPDIPQNAATLLRLAACMAIEVDVVEPCGFLFSDRHFRRAGLDYLDHARWTRHANWAAYSAQNPPGRLIALCPKGEASHVEFAFEGADRLMVGRESQGLPPEIAEEARARVRIPMRAGLRSLNVAVAAAMVLGEALRQTGLYPDGDFPSQTAS